MQKNILAGDIGGTKTHLAIFSGPGGNQHILRRKTYKSSDYRSFSALLADFLVGTPPAAACFAVAGPVMDNKARLTNLPWQLDAKALAAATGGSKIYLLNDLTATALGIQTLAAADILTLNQGQARAQANIGVIAPGTGLGEAFLVWNGSDYTAHASEGGHGDFAPTDQLQAGLSAYLQTKYTHVSYERVCSGMGLPDIYAYLRKEGGEDGAAARQISQAADATPLIIDFALHRQDTCPICRRALDIFISALAAEAGNLALKIMATGGIYIGGGIPPRIVAALQADKFMTSFTAKGRMADILKQIPVHVILNSDAALFGAALNAQNRSFDEK